MFSFDKLKRIQVEITNRCQASCPMCLRNIHGGISNPSLILTDWDLKRFQSVFSTEVLEQINSISFCGNFGDPIMNNSLIDMCQYAKEINPGLEIVISTNGSAHTIDWWGRLAKSLPTQHKVIFAIDGLKETNGIYRIGTDYDLIIRNATAFISAGGIAHWMFIRFKHNEHEIDIAKSTAEKLGFAAFTLKDSKRFGKKFPVLDRTGKIVYHIEPPTQSRVKPVEFVNLKDYKQWHTDVSCFSFEDKEVFIDANGYIMPCCLISSFLYANYDVELYQKYGVVDEHSVIGIARELQLEVFEIIKELGGLNALDSKIIPIKDIMNSRVWQTLMHTRWSTHSSSVCKILCGDSGPFIKIAEQINRT